METTTAAPPKEQAEQELGAEAWAALAATMSGVWLKDKQVSDSMDPVCSLMQLSTLVRAAVGLIKGLEIKITPEQFDLSVLSGILWFKIRESYPTSGEPRQVGRRDMRRGKHTGRVELRHASGAGGATDGSSGASGNLPALALSYEWGEPHGGGATDVLRCPRPDLLWMDTTIGRRKVGCLPPGLSAQGVKPSWGE